MNDLLHSEFVTERLVAGAGETSFITAIAHTHDNTWMIEVEGLAPCLVEIEDTAGLVFSADVGIPPDGRQCEVRGAALSYNALWRETGDARLVQAGEAGELTLVRRFFPDAVADQEFPAALAQFLLSAIWWTTYVAMAEVDPANSNLLADRFGLFA